jgi:lysophospholipase L1-like esterase
VPEGNYDVTIGLGGDTESTTTVKAEARRLLVDKLQVSHGKVKTRDFTLNVRATKLATGEVVHLKKDEQNEFDWDNQLTLEFNNSHPCVSSLRINRTDRAITVYLAGDSTVTDQRREPWAAWGQMLPRFFKAGVAVANFAESGESLKSFIAENRLPKLLETMKAGDYLFIQFAHNDQKPGASHVDAFTTYQEYLRLYIKEARKKGAIPVLVTSMHRRNFDAANKIVNTLEDYPEAMRQLARQESVALIDLNAMSKSLFEALGPEGTLKAFVHFPAGTFPGQDKELKDDTHFTAYGAYELARCVVEGIRTSKLGLAKYLVKDAGRFDPAYPDPVSIRSLPLSPFPTEQKLGGP